MFPQAVAIMGMLLLFVCATITFIGILVQENKKQIEREKMYARFKRDSKMFKPQ